MILILFIHELSDAVFVIVVIKNCIFVTIKLLYLNISAVFKNYLTFCMFLITLSKLFSHCLKINGYILFDGSISQKI